MSGTTIMDGEGVKIAETNFCRLKTDILQLTNFCIFFLFGTSLLLTQSANME